MAESIVVKAAKAGSIAGIDNRIAIHRERIAKLTVEEFDSRGGTFLKRSPEVTSSERAIVTLLALRDEVRDMDLSALVKSA